MLSKLKWIALGLVVFLAAFLGFVATKPDTFKLERSATIQAPPEKVYEQLANFHNWKNWSPWDNLEGDKLKRTFAGPDAGLGAEYGWEGEQSGQGHMKIVEAVAPSKIQIALDFIKPFEASNLTVFTMEPQAEGTKVTWTMSGPQPFISKLMCTFISMDDMVGKDFEKGLASLKAVAEKK